MCHFHLTTDNCTLPIPYNIRDYVRMFSFQRFILRFNRFIILINQKRSSINFELAVINSLNDSIIQRMILRRAKTSLVYIDTIVSPSSWLVRDSLVQVTSFHTETHFVYIIQPLSVCLLQRYRVVSNL